MGLGLIALWQASTALAVGEAVGASGREALEAMIAGVEVMCRASLVAPKRIHQAGFHPTAVLGAMGAAGLIKGYQIALGADLVAEGDKWKVALPGRRARPEGALRAAWAALAAGGDRASPDAR